MIEKKCEKALKALEEYIHNELCKDESRDIREHIKTCPECSAEHNVAVVLKETIAKSCKEQAPENLRDQILKDIREKQASH